MSDKKLQLKPFFIPKGSLTWMFYHLLFKWVPSLMLSLFFSALTNISSWISSSNTQKWGVVYHGLGKKTSSISYLEKRSYLSLIILFYTSSLFLLCLGLHFCIPALFSILHKVLLIKCLSQSLLPTILNMDKPGKGQQLQLLF